MTSALDLLSAAALLDEQEQGPRLHSTASGFSTVHSTSIPIDPALDATYSNDAAPAWAHKRNILSQQDGPGGAQYARAPVGSLASILDNSNTNSNPSAAIYNSLIDPSLRQFSSSLPSLLNSSNENQSTNVSLAAATNLVPINNSKSSPTFNSLPPLPPLPDFPKPKPPPFVPSYAVDEDSGIIRCICSFTADDGFTIQCETCNVWQHAACVNILPEAVPEEYNCELCDEAGAANRRVDRVQAEIGMKRRIEFQEDMKRLNSLGMDSQGQPLQPHELPAVPLDSTAPKFDTPRSASGSRSKPTKRNSTASANFDPNQANSQTNTADGLGTIPGNTAGTLGGVARDAIGRKRRVAKQPGAGKVRAQAANQTTPNSSAPTTPAAIYANSSTPNGLLPEAPIFDASSARFNATGNRVDSDSDSSSEQDFHQPWQNEFTAITTNLYADQFTVDRIQSVLSTPQNSMQADDTTPPTLLESLRARQAEHGAQIENCALVEAIYSNEAYLKFEQLPAPSRTTIKPLASTNFHLLPPVASTYVSTSNLVPICPYPRATVHALFASKPISAGSFIAQVKGKVCTLETYCKDPVNQYDVLGVPKQGVRFLPHPFSLAIDSRMFGDKIRFARNGCHPNAIIKPIRLNQPIHSAGAFDWLEQTRAKELNQHFVFGLFAVQEISRHEEIVLPWEWHDFHLVHNLPTLMKFPPLDESIAVDSLYPLACKMSMVSTAILSHTHCACEKKRDCALFWLNRAGLLVNQFNRIRAADGATNKRENFELTLLNTLAQSGLNEQNLGGNSSRQGKSKKSKKVDLGHLLGLERGWILKEPEKLADMEPIQMRPQPEPIPIQLDAQMGSPQNLMEIDEIASEKTEVALKEEIEQKIVSSPPRGFEPVSSLSPIPLTSPVQPSVAPQSDDSDDSDLTEPLSNISSDESEPEPEPVAVPKIERELTDPEEEDASESEEDVKFSVTKAKIGLQKKRLVSGVTKTKASAPKAVNGEQVRQPKIGKRKDSAEILKPAKKIRRAKNSIETATKSKRCKNRAISKTSSPEPQQFDSERTRDLTPPPRPAAPVARQPSFSSETPGDAIMKEITETGVETVSSEAEAVTSLRIPSPPPPPPREPTPPPMPPPPPPAPRARLSLAAYRQRLAQNQTEPANSSESPIEAVAPLLPAVQDNTLVKAISVTTAQSLEAIEATQEATAAASLPLVDEVPKAALNSAEDILNNISAYFDTAAAKSTPPILTTPLPQQPMNPNPPPSASPPAAPKRDLSNFSTPSNRAPIPSVPSRGTSSRQTSPKITPSTIPDAPRGPRAMTSSNSAASLAPPSAPRQSWPPSPRSELPTGPNSSSGYRGSSRGSYPPRGSYAGPPLRGSSYGGGGRGFPRGGRGGPPSWAPRGRGNSSRGSRGGM